MKHKYKVGQLVIVLKSSHQNIQPGNIGKVESYEDLGYGVSFYKWWPPVLSGDKGKEEKRIIFFEEKEIKLQ